MKVLFMLVAVVLLGGAGCAATPPAGEARDDRAGGGARRGLEPMPAEEARRPAVQAAEVPEDFFESLLEQGPPEGREFWWGVRKIMQDGTPEQRQELIAQLKGGILAMPHEELRGWGGMIAAGSLVMAGEEAAPVVLDFLAGEPGRSRESNQVLAHLAAAVIRAMQHGEIPEEMPERIQGVIMLPQRTVVDGVAAHRNRLAGLLSAAVESAQQAPAAAGGPGAEDDGLYEVLGFMTFEATALAGRRLEALHEFLLGLAERHEGLGGDLAIATAAAVAPERAARDRPTRRKLAAVASRRPHAAMVAGHENRELLAELAAEAMRSEEASQQRAGLVLARRVVEGSFAVEPDDFGPPNAVTRHLRPGLERLSESGESRIRRESRQVLEMLEGYDLFGD